MSWMPGDVSLAERLTTQDHLYNDHINQLRSSMPVSATVGLDPDCEYACDGTDDHVQINAAITDVNAAGGGVVLIRGSLGTYNLSSYITLKSNVRVVGEGKATVLKQINGANIDELIRGNAITGASLENLKVDYNHVNNPTCNRGMRIIAPSTYIDIIGCTFINAKGFAIGLWGGGTGDVSIRSSHCRVVDNLVTDIVTTQNDMVLVVGDRHIVTDNTIIGVNKNVGLMLYEADYMIATNNRVELTSDTNQIGIGVFSMRYSHVSSNTVVGAFAGTGVGITITTEHDNVSPITSKRNTVTDNVVIGVGVGASILESDYDWFAFNRIESVSNAISYPAGTPAINPFVHHNKFMSVAGTVTQGSNVTTPSYFGNQFSANANFGIGTISPNTSALLDLTSTTESLLIPRMTTTQKNALTATNGMMVYDSTLNKFQGYENGSWVSFV